MDFILIKRQLIAAEKKLGHFNGHYFFFARNVLMIGTNNKICLLQIVLDLNNNLKTFLTKLKFCFLTQKCELT